MNTQSVSSMRQNMARQARAISCQFTLTYKWPVIISTLLDNIMSWATSLLVKPTWDLLLII